MKILEQNSKQLKLKLESNIEGEWIVGSTFLVGIVCVFAYALIFTDWLSINSFKYSSTGITIVLLGGLFIYLGLSYLVRHYPESCCFDKNIGKFTLKTKSYLLGLKTSEYLLTDISSVKVVIAQVEDPDYYISLVTVLKKEIDLTTKYNSAPKGNTEIAQQIADFLNISLIDKT